MHKESTHPLFYSLLLILALLLGSRAHSQERVNFYTLNYPPLSMHKGPRGSGLGCDLIHEINRRLHSKSAVTFGKWENIYQKALHTKNTGIFPTNLTPERAPHFNWVGPFCQSAYYVYQSNTRKNLITSREDILSVKSIATVKEYAMNEDLIALGCKNLRYYNNPNEAIISVILGKSDICIFPTFILDTFYKESGYDVNTEVQVYKDSGGLSALLNGDNGVQLSYGTSYESYNDIKLKHKELGRPSTQNFSNRPDVIPVLLYKEEDLFFALNQATPLETAQKMQQALYDIQQSKILQKLFTKYHIPLECMPEIPPTLKSSTTPVIPAAIQPPSQKTAEAVAVNEKMTVYAERFPPLTFTAKDSNYLQGAAVDLIAAIYKELGQKPEKIILDDWNIIYNKAQTTPNSVVCTLKRIPEREDLFYWIGPYAADSAWLYARRDFSSQISDIASAKEIPVIACIDQTFAATVLKNEGFKNLLLKSKPDDAIIQMLDNPEYAGAFSSVSAPYMIRDAGYSPINVKPLLQVSQKTNYYIGISRSTPPAIAQKWLQAFQKIKESGELKKILERWIK